MSHRRSSKGRRTLQVSAPRTGTIYKFDAIVGTDGSNNNGILTRHHTKLYNLCAMTVYEKKSTEELRFEDYIDNRKFPLTTTNPSPSSYTKSLFGGSTTDQTKSIFDSNTTTTSATLGLSLFENKSAVSTAPPLPFTFGIPMTTTAAVATPFAFSSSPATYPSGPFNSFVPATASVTSSSPFIFGSGQATTTTTTFKTNFALALRELKNYTSDSDEEKASTIQRQSRTGRKSSRTPSPEIVRICADCKKTPHMQCLHCSKQVCMDCAQKHVALVAEQVDVAQHALDDKMSILDRLSVAAKERVNAERDKIIQQADTERDQAFVQIDELLEQQKKQIQDKSTQLGQLSLDKISFYIQRMTSEMEELNDNNDQLFCVTCTPPKIQVQHKH